MKEEERVDARVIDKEYYEIWKERNVGTIRGNSLKQDHTSAKDITPRDASAPTIV